MDDVRENDQCLFYVGVTIILLADSKKELDQAAKNLETIQKNGGISEAAKAMITNAENKVKEAEKALTEAQKVLL